MHKDLWTFVSMNTKLLQDIFQRPLRKSPCNIPNVLDKITDVFNESIFCVTFGTSFHQIRIGLSVYEPWQKVKIYINKSERIDVFNKNKSKNNIFFVSIFYAMPYTIQFAHKFYEEVERNVNGKKQESLNIHISNLNSMIFIYASS